MRNKISLTLCPKVNSLIDCVGEMKASIGIITESWLTNGDNLDEDIDGLCQGAGLGLICLNRPVNNRDFSHGGVAVISKV